jgi:hypothetical protein
MTPRCLGALLGGLLLLLGLAIASCAVAAELPAWSVRSVSSPTNLQPGEPSTLTVTATNVGAVGIDGGASPIVLSEVLPAGLKATKVVGFDAYAAGEALDGETRKGEPFAPSAGGMSCTTTPEVRCTYGGVVDPGDVLRMIVTVSVEPPLGEGSSVVDEASVSGGGASASASGNVTVSSTPARFGVAEGSVVAAMSSSQAGAHSNFTAAFSLATDALNEPAVNAKDVDFDLPVGLVDSASELPRCSALQLAELTTDPDVCPADTMVGMETMSLSLEPPSVSSYVFPIYNIEPSPGEPVAFAFNAIAFLVRLDTSVISAGDYGVRLTARELPESARILSSSTTIWGVPADHSGPGSHGERTYFKQTFGGPAAGVTRAPLLTAPQQCSQALSASVAVDSWSEPGVFAPAPPVSLGTANGCGLLPFPASFSMLADTLAAGAPAGYSFNLSVPQSTDPDGLASASIERMSMTLPLGTVLSPSGADGLAVCSDAQFALRSGGPGACPPAAQVGMALIETPALAEPLQGQVFLGEPSCGPCTSAEAQSGRMVRLFVQVLGEGEPAVVVKLEGSGRINQQTGQITLVFDQTPQLPLSELRLSLDGGERALLANPRACAPASTSLDLTPWSAPFMADFTASDTFEVNEDCIGSQFDPSFSAHTASEQGGGYDPITLSFARTDSDEFLSAIQTTLAPGLLGMISSVSLCGEPQAAQGTCGAGSLIGHVTVGMGPGADPLLVEGGQVFLTGPYRGAPYGLSIVVPATLGPYALSGTNGAGEMVVRAAIDVDPRTTALTITSDPFPSMLDGVPLQLRFVNIMLDRPDFMFNPTNCGPLRITSTISSTQNATATVAAPFQATNCAALGFAPKITFSTSAKTSRPDGASLYVRIDDPRGEAVAGQVRAELPKQLPARITTLQKACRSTTFETNPAACPPGSLVGAARSSMPMLPNIFAGPVYLVSYGSAKFPELVVVLQDEGVRVDLHGETFISAKTGITSSTFATIPDVPVNYFEMILPMGPYSALAANGDLCKEHLVIPNSFVGENGAVTHHSTPLTVTGCPKAKKDPPRKKRSHHPHRRPAPSKAGARARFSRVVRTSATAPIVEEELPSASSITRTSAVLSGTVDPDGEDTIYYFVYGTSEAYGSSTPALEGGSGTEGEPAGPQTVTGLQPETTYHFALVASNEDGTVTGPDQTFTTTPRTPPLASTGPATEITQTSATLTGSIQTNGLQTSYGLQIGTEAGDYGPDIVVGDEGGTNTETLTLSLSELQPETTYHYRVYATNQDGTSYGADIGFTTAGYPNPLAQPLTPLLLPTPTTKFPSETPVATGKAQSKPRKKGRPRRAGRRGKKKQKQ